MTDYDTIKVVKVVTLLLNLVVLALYRYGDDGYFLGTTFNSSQDGESLGSAVYIGFLIYNIVSLIDMSIDRSGFSNVTDILMQLIGTVLWLTSAGVTMDFWLNFVPRPHLHLHTSVMGMSDPSASGIALGTVSLINGVIYLIGTILSYRSYIKYIVYRPS